jgi:L-lactate utilization protein LutB
MALLGAVGLMKEQVFEFLERIYSAQRKRDEQTRRLIDEALSKIVRERQKSERRLQGRIEALRNSLREAMQPIIADLNERVALVRSEGSKLGYNL